MIPQLVDPTPAEQWAPDSGGSVEVAAAAATSNALPDAINQEDSGWLKSPRASWRSQLTNSTSRRRMTRTFLWPMVPWWSPIAQPAWRTPPEPCDLVRASRRLHGTGFDQGHGGIPDERRCHQRRLSRRQCHCRGGSGRLHGQSPRMYYDFKTDEAVMVDAVMHYDRETNAGLRPPSDFVRSRRTGGPARMSMSPHRPFPADALIGSRAVTIDRVPGGLNDEGASSNPPFSSMPRTTRFVLETCPSSTGLNSEEASTTFHCVV